MKYNIYPTYDVLNYMYISILTQTISINRYGISSSNCPVSFENLLRILPR